MVQLEWTPIPSTCTFYKMTTTQQHCFCRTLSVLLPPTAAVSAALVIRSFRVFSPQVVLIRWRWQCLPCHSNSPRLQVQLSTFASSTLHVCKFNSPRLQVQLSTFASRSYQLAQLDPSSSQLVSRSSSLSFNWFPEAVALVSFGFQKQLVPLNFVSLNWISVALIWIPEAARAIQLRPAFSSMCMANEAFLLQLHSRGEGVSTSLPRCPARLWMFLFPSIRWRRAFQTCSYLVPSLLLRGYSVCNISPVS
jgi:hypothetical protein